MTGFGQGRRSTDGFTVGAALRSVNSRSLDLVVRLPEGLRALEPAVRERVAAALGRGRVEVAFEVRRDAEELGPGGGGERRSGLLPDVETIARLRREAAVLHGHGLLDDTTLRLSDLLVARAQRVGEEELVVDEVSEPLLAALAEGLAELLAFRRREGAVLRGLLAERLDAMQALAQSLAARRGEVELELLAGLRRRLATLLADLPGAPTVPEERLLAEAAMLVDRSSVAEELDRLVAHLEHARGLLGAAEPVGRRLDFLAQEIHRELSTLGSKCRDLAMAREVMTARKLCEELREQVQNVE